ncbi:MAG: undecaprenyl/decaprenyl-phosphate alpha-N-acetylglucosaminyl 1-phosphate transferase [Clostridia bacterium]|nr:undecaprenyl/decaprenyl-phosphate alpha-N-acetylglucosaminyl 1-phosphate transferase [Clostridia bacterium]MBQ3092366.1 undecaprenyl/decaprenyl-phosphate alpha-N-acetylglucosaminyl 1-phosphate transferase [Clostridia bacterium]
MNNSVILTSLLAFATALGIAFALTPVVKSFAFKIGAVDVPKDNRRMHKTPIPRVGGLAIYLGFLVSVLIFGNMTAELQAILLGSVVLILLGVVDDVVALSPKIKFVGQIAAAGIVMLADVRIEVLSNPFGGELFNLGWLSYPITLVWIVGMINAVNFIDGLDGLACGVSSIASLTVFTIALLVSEPYVAIIMAALTGACFGFLPYNMNPAKIFMGDTGSMFLGYMLAVMSINGLFKLYAVISFVVPFLILGLPIFDTAFAIVRRLLKGQSPLQADRGHIHHRLVDLGFDQKQSVAILYAVSVVLGLAAVIFTTSGEMKIAIVAVAILLCFFFAMNIKVNHKKQEERKAPDEEKK